MNKSYCIFRTFPPAILGANGGASYSPDVAYLARCRVGGGSGGAGSLLQEAGRDRSGAMLRGSGLGGGGVPGVQSKGGRSGVPAATYYGAREEGTGGAGTLGKESLRHPYMPPSCDWCVPHSH